MLNILVIGFNRSRLIKQQLTMLDNNPLIQSVFLVIDGPRENNESDREQQEDISVWVDTFEPSYELSCIFAKTNRGCKRGVEFALDNFFNTFEDGIILEDDCHVDPLFFELFLQLKHYLSTESVFMLSGCSFIENASAQQLVLSKNPHIWGWATTSTKWKQYRQATNYYTLKNLIRVMFRNTILENIYFVPKWLQASKKKIDTWDYDLSFYLRLTKQRCIVPGFNLVENVGIEAAGAHQIKITDDLCNKEVGLNIQLLKLHAPTVDPQYDKSVILRRLNNKVRKWLTRC